MVYGVFDWAVECVASLPVGVGHPEFFPGNVSLVYIMRSYLQKMSVAEDEVAGGVHGFEWPAHRSLVLL